MTTIRERYQIVPFAGANFSTWAFRIKSVLKDNGVLKAIEEENFNDDDQNSTHEAKAQAILIAGVADSHIEYLKKESAFEIFKKISKRKEFALSYY